LLLVVEILVKSGIAGIGLLEPPEREYVFRKQLAPNKRIQEVHIPFEDFDMVGRFVVQNWEHEGPAVAKLISMKIFA
jgi:hypothetical protein